MTEINSPTVYAGIIDDIGRRQYSGNITWLREYIQNAIDSGSQSIEIKLYGKDLEIVDHGEGMDRETIITQAFSIGKSFKKKEKIGELGIGMYAGSGICDTITVRTKMAGKATYIATIDMKGYREIIREAANMTFEDMMKKIFHVREEEIKASEKSFTQIRFENLSRDTLRLMEDTDLKRFIEYTVDLPISEKFPHRDSIYKLLEGVAHDIDLILDINGTITHLKKFELGHNTITDTFWAKDIKADDGTIIGKIWAAYNKSGVSLTDARILLKRKGLTIGDETIVHAQFHAKYSPRFYGEVILLDDRIEINTSRDWFVASNYLQNFVKNTQSLLNELYSIADFDSKVAVGIINLAKSNVKLEKLVEKNTNKSKIGLAIQNSETIQDNKEKIYQKIELAKEFKEKASNGEIDLKDPTNKMKLELVNRALDTKEVQSYLKEPISAIKTGVSKSSRKNAWPKIVITFLKQNIVDSNLAKRIGDGDIKDTTDRVFTFIEQKLKQMLQKKEGEYVEWKALMTEFKSNYSPPDLNGFSLEKYMEAFNGIINGTHTIFRNKSNHTFMDDMQEPRNVIEIIAIGDFIVRWLDQWSKK